MTGVKYKLAHKRAGSEKWSAGEHGRRRALVRILCEMIEDLEREPAAAKARATAAERALPARERAPRARRAAPRQAARRPARAVAARR
jgi:hypothetical protein